MRHIINLVKASIIDLPNCKQKSEIHTVNLNFFFFLEFLFKKFV